MRRANFLRSKKFWRIGRPNSPRCRAPPFTKRGLGLFEACVAIFWVTFGRLSRPWGESHRNHDMPWVRWLLSAFAVAFLVLFATYLIRGQSLAHASGEALV